MTNFPTSKPITPELEHVDVDARSVLAFQHGFPSPLVRWHRHEDYEIHVIVAGAGKMFVGDHVSSFSPFQLVLLGPQQPHNWISETATDEVVELRDFVVQFRRELVPSMALSVSELSALLPLLERAQYGIEFSGPICRDAATWSEKMIASDNISRIAMLLDFLGKLTRETNYRLLSATPPDASQSEETQDKISKITGYIAEHHARDLRLAEVSAISQMSESTFSRFFTKATGCNFSRYLNRLRIAHACELLSKSDEPVTSICHDVGYNNVANFNRHFKDYKSMTPREYRKQVKTR
ncbi:AraC family transcriptional regulator [Granulosicoccus antarcticus]|uniref:HTH-type transcriptional activator Btr n=1 Tax=Granulosicoccus antarcticus IMCC3135 TaxID=1192854 RepID=A0A2Z2NRX2_9GAMM|nr:AraC family transcriptional regulator [Granulosicoccus antarcticus]ASJ74123.1 HTH-type transcriptional activator Btr [Granulosicoccus antarcticus IMCC3135]